MTLFRQIALMLSIFLLIILATVLTINFNSANTSVQERLYEDAKNTASSLSLSLASAQGEISMMATMINANFDSGNYNYISLVGLDNEVLYERKSESKPLDVPAWFVNAVPIHAPLALANVSAGWNPIGLLHVKSDVSHAYTQLFSILKNLLISFSILAVIGLVILNLLIAATLKPLKKVQFQAESVIRKEFIIQENIPYTKEFRDVVLGMNNMVFKVKAMFDKGNEELKKHKELEYTDKSTKLKNRKYLIDKLPEYLKIDASSKGGINMMIALSGVVQANEKIGHKDVDRLFVEIAQIFSAHASNYENSIVSRMNGTEFSILLPDCSDTEAMKLATSIYKATTNSVIASGLKTEETFVSIGLYEYNYRQSIAQLLSLCDNALSQAKIMQGHIHLDKAEDAVEVMGKDAWRAIISDAIEHNRFSFVSWSAVDAKARKIAHNVLSVSMEGSDSTTYSYGQYMASAIQIGLSPHIYKSIINMMFKTPDLKLKNSVCSLRLSSEYLMQEDTFTDLKHLLKEYAHKLPFKLIVEVPDKFVRHNAEQIRSYKNLFEMHGIELGLFEFIGEGGDYKYLQDLRPVYIKGESSYFISQSEQSLSALKLITDAIGISLIASGVMDEKTLKELMLKEITIVQGRATERIELA